MSSYTNTHILEANRLHSAQYGKSDTKAIWQNDINDGIKLDIGDEVSLHSAFVSDLGAEDSTIEFKGTTIQDTQEFEVTKVENVKTITYLNVENNACKTHPKFYLRSNISSSKVVVNNIKDTDVNVLISYYKSNNGEYMFHLPIKFAVPQSPDDNDMNNSWRAIRENKKEITGGALAPDVSHRFAPDYTYNSQNLQEQLNVDGSRFMIFGRPQTNYIQLKGDSSDSHIETRDLFYRDIKYIRIKDLLQLKAPVGFNSPSQISNVITDGFQKQTDISPNNVCFYNGSRLIEKPTGIKNETSTNKLFDCATFGNISTDAAEPFFGTSFGAKTPPTNSSKTFDYETGYQYIGIKRPEIYETGIETKQIYLTLKSFDRLGTEDAELLFDDFNPTSTNEIEFDYLVPNDVEKLIGALDNTNIANYDYVNELPFGIVGKDDTKILSQIHTNIPWTLDNLQLFEKFFQSQERYPELFDMNIEGCELYYNKKIYNASTYAGDEITPETHRYLHLGGKKNSEMARVLKVETDGTINATEVSFGYDNIPSIFSDYGSTYGAVGGKGAGVNTSGTDFSTAPLFINYYENQRTNNPTDVENFPYYDGLSDSNVWGGFATRSPPSLVVRDSGTAMSLDRDFSAKDIDKGEYTDNISFLAVVPKPYLIQKSLKTFHNSNGTASGTIQTHNIYTLGYVEWYEKLLNPAIYGSGKTFNLDDCDTIKVGYDSHPNAYGNAYIGLYNGACTNYGFSYDKEYSQAVDKNNPITYYNTAGSLLAPSVQPDPLFSERWNNKIYIGAIEPELSFDTITSRFAISSLHSPERITAKYDATLVKTATSGKSASLSQGQVIPVPDNNGKECFKINKVFDRRNFCPTITPYINEIGIDINGTTADDLFAFPYLNQIVKKGSIIDSNSGIFIEDFNILEKNWEESFWGICGFSYANLNNNDTGNINERVFTGVLGNIARITTNAQVINDDLLEWNGGATGVPAQKYTIPSAAMFAFQNACATTHAIRAITDAPLEVECDSVKIEASNLPTKTLRPYFIIRSDIISDSYFNGGTMQKSAMPVLSVIPKESQYGDYYYATDDTTFTITHPRTITKVTTQITDPSGELSNISANSSVLYKITKSKQSNAQILQQVLQNNKPK